MDQIQNSMLQVMQAVTTNRQSAAPEGRDKSGKDDFRKLMDGQQQAADSAAAGNSKTDAPQDGETLEVTEDPKLLQEKMMLAAAAMLQNPVVTQAQDPVEVAEQVSGTEVQAVETLAAQPETVMEAPESLAETELPKVNAEGMTVRESGVEPVEVTETPAEVTETVEAVQTVENGEELQDDGEERKELDVQGETVVFQDVKEIPVKVGEPEAAERPAEAQPVETQIGEKLTEALKSGETRVELQLTPENLGKVTIEVTVHQDGTLHVALHAENSQTRGLLERDLSGLQSMLARNTQQEVRVEVQRQQESQRQDFYDGRQGQERQNPQQQRRQRKETSEDFLHQLRLGLIPVDGE